MHCAKFYVSKRLDAITIGAAAAGSLRLGTAALRRAILHLERQQRVVGCPSLAANE